MKDLCVLIPSYNEEGTIGALVRGLKNKGLSVFVVDDGSKDNTSAMARGEGAEVIRHETNKGKGAALVRGFAHILKTSFDAVLVMDGDDQHKIEDIPNFTKRMEETDADIIVGNRMTDAALMPFVRRQTNRFMSGLISRISCQYMPDSQCGFRLIKRAVLEKIKLESSNYEIESEMLIKAARAGFKIQSVPIKTVYQNERSRINPIIDTLRFIALMIKLRS